MNKQGIKVISIPNKKYEKILVKNFPTLKINEFRTSIIHNKKEKLCENDRRQNLKDMIKSVYSLEQMRINKPERYEKIIRVKKIHKILVCKTKKELCEESYEGESCDKKPSDEELCEYVNRDKNSVKNMIKIVSSYIKDNHKPKTFVFGTKICSQILLDQ